MRVNIKIFKGIVLFAWAFHTKCDLTIGNLRNLYKIFIWKQHMQSRSMRRQLINLRQQQFAWMKLKIGRIIGSKFWLPRERGSRGAAL
jgi:hypothetical protein